MATYFVQNTNSVEDIEQMNNVIDKVNKVNTEATSNIGQLTELNTKAEELSNNIKQALPINTELKENIKIGQPLVQEATSKNTELQVSLEKTKEFIDGLDGSQNIPQLRLDVTELQNGLKSNQALSYEGSSISAENTLEGRTEGMRIGGRTLQNLFNIKRSYISTNNKQCVCESSNSNYSNGEYTLINLINKAIAITIYDNVSQSFIRTIKILGNEKKKITLSENEYIYSNNGIYDGTVWNGTEAELEELKQSLLVLRGGYANVEINSYFEGIKSFGESEGNKISILSNGKNIYNGEDLYIYKPEEKWRVINIPNIPKFELGKTYKVSYKTTESVILKIILTYENNEDAYSSSESPLVIAKDKGKVKRLRFYIEESDYSTNKKFIITNIQIEEGTQATPYEPYKSDKKDILIKEPLREWDSMYEDNGQVKVYRDARKYVITGNEDWSQYTDNRDFTCMGFFLQLNKIFDAKLGGKFICNNFKGSDTDVFPGNITVDDEIIFVKGRSGEASPSYIKISISKSKLTTQNVEGFKEWLKANPTEIIYQLATPVTEVVDGVIDIDLDTYQEKTYFNILNSLPGTLDFKVPSNIGSVVQNMAKEVNNIWDVINNLLVPSIVKANGNLAMIKLNNNLN